MEKFVYDSQSWEARELIITLRHVTVNAASSLETDRNVLFTDEKHSFARLRSLQLFSQNKFRKEYLFRNYLKRIYIYKND